MPGKLGPALMVAGGLATTAAIAGALAATHEPAPTPAADPTVTVVDIVDGDTFDVARAGETVRVRLLNVDTPESVDPNRPPECGGAEAAAWLERRLPPGSVVTLTHDEERLDTYGRELAWVTAADGGVVNLEIARAGLGEAMVVEPNHAHYQEVVEAQAQAKAAGAGLYGTSMDCVLPAQVQRQITALEQASGSALGESDGDLLAALAGTAAVEAALTQEADTVAGRMLDDATLARLRDSLRRAHDAAQARQDELEAETEAEEARLAAEAEAARRAAEEAARHEAAEREAAARRAEEERRAAEAAAEEERRRTEAETQLRAPRDAPAVHRTPDDPPPPDARGGEPASDDEYPGYTGPRCYEPGGQVWHPC